MTIAFALALQAAATDPNWRVVALPDGGELGYLLVTAGDADYPLPSKRAGIEGTSVVTITIALDGSISGCTVLQTAGSRELDDKACTLYRERGRFEVSGRTQPVIVHAPMKWVLVE